MSYIPDKTPVQLMPIEVDFLEMRRAVGQKKGITITSGGETFDDVIIISEGYEPDGWMSWRGQCNDDRFRIYERPHNKFVWEKITSVGSEHCHPTPS